MKKKRALGHSVQDDILLCKKELIEFIASTHFGSLENIDALTSCIINYLNKTEKKQLQSILSDSDLENNRNLSANLIEFLERVRNRLDPNPIPID